MQAIHPNIRPNEQGVTVANLHIALDKLNFGETISSPERAEQHFGEGTVESVRRLQAEFGIHTERPGEIDQQTAELINQLLLERGIFRLVWGQITNQDGSLVAENLFRVRAFDKENLGGAFLGSANTNADGIYQIFYDPLLYARPGEGVLKIKEIIDLIVQVYDANGQTLAESQPMHDPQQKVRVNLQVGELGKGKPFTIVGAVSSRSRAGVGGLRVEIIDKNVGEDVRLKETQTDDTGAYNVTVTISHLEKYCKQRPDLQARVFIGDKLLGTSEVRYNASDYETLNILLDDKASSLLSSEYESLIAALTGHCRVNLSDLRETDDRQDITYLANKTGWDARAVALAALAEQFSARTMDVSGVPAIPQAFFYALFRAGLPANEDTLYHTDTKTLKGVWNAAVEQGVIPEASADYIPNLIGRFQVMSAQKLLTGPALIGPSSLKEILTISRLNDTQQKQFADLYAMHRTDKAKFWDAVASSFGAEAAHRLQVDGKLGFLTLNNASLMQKVHAKAGPHGLPDLLQLAQMGYHRAESWNQLLTADIPIPKEIPGDTIETKQINYANYLSAQVRLSYPTAALAQMVKAGDLPLTGAAQGISDQVHAFLTEHQDMFEIGVQPVQQYITQNNLQVAEETVQQVKRLQRVYQITPSDRALTGLMKRGVDAAYHVVRYDKDTFVQSFADDLGGADHAALTYDRSVQIHNAVLNITLSYLTARTAPAIGVHSPPSVIDPVPANTGDVIAYATLEKLFSSMDFCACDHCRSILSPAAYLVDLLLFLHSDEREWTDFSKNWMSEHSAPYPFPNKAAWDTANNPQNTEISPFDVLMSRRPDIQHLPLTCENTNTALPYIDVVNETLEYYIANGLTLEKNKLDEYLGHDTNGVASEDLLASPQFVMDSTYTTLRSERFPAQLPFHQPLGNLRRYFDKFEVPLPLAMERFRKNDDLERGANPYGWRDILMEEIGLSRAEYEILTDSNAVPLWRVYGFSNGTADADVIAGLSNAKQFARRVGIGYEDLASVLKTRFINPNSDLIPKLERLGVNFTMLAELKTKNDVPTDAKFDALLAKLAVPPDPVEYGGDIKAWVKNDANYARIMGLFTLAIPVNTWTASKAYAVGDCVLPAAPQAGSTLYYECTAAGTSAASEPRWPMIPGKNTDPDGTVIWACRDASSCHSFDNLAFRYSDPAKLTQNMSAVEFVRLLRFIRLWKKLGWTIERTDAAICALYRFDMAPLDAGDVDTVAKLDAGFFTLLPRLGIVIRVMKALNLTVKRDLLSLLACWSEIGTRGDTALYRQMFLTPSILKQDAVFADNGYGKFLTDTTKKLADHTEALCAAFNLTGQELYLITADLGFKILLEASYKHTQPTLEQAILDIAPAIGYDDLRKQLFYAGVLSTQTRDKLKTAAGVSAEFQAAVDALFAANPTLTELTIAKLSAIYRRGWLARKLRLSVRELLLLIKFTDLDPFAVPDPTKPAILRLISLIQVLKDRSLKFNAALYLIWNQDLSGKSAPDSAQVAAFARMLRLGLTAVETEFAVAEDPDGSIGQNRMTMVYGADAAAFFFGLLNDTLTVEVEFSDPDKTMSPGVMLQTIENAAGKTDTGVPKVVYDDFRKCLSYSGALTATTRDAIKSAAGLGAAAFKAAVENLYNKNQAVISSFFTRYPELQSYYDAYASDTTHSATEKRSYLLKAILPELIQRRKRQQTLQAMSTLANTDLAFTQTFLNPPAAPFPLHAAGHADQPALNDLLKLETPGLSVQFFASDTPTGAIIPSSEIASKLDYAPVVSGVGNPLPANPTSGAAISGVWRGYLEAPESGFFNLRIEADAGATVTLLLDSKPVALVQTGTFWNNTDPIELRVGTLYSINLTVEKVRNVVRAQWEWEPKGQGRTVIPPRYLYPAVPFETFKETYVRFLKVASLATGLGLTANELAFFGTHSDYYVNGDGWLNILSVSDNPAPAIVSALLKSFEALLDFGRIKTEISPSDESLLTVLRDPSIATKSPDRLLFTITRWNPISLNEVLAQFSGNIAGLEHFDLFQRVYDAFALIQKMGISAKALIQATTNEPAADTVRNLQAALRVRYDATDWRNVVGPINDEMRSLQRDALVAYILHQMRSHPESAHIDTPDKLFEYFLMDVQMDPCMQTSRVRNALSSVQLFIERCLMNLEPRVSPAAINAKQWEWMKRYRVWEANRKVFLFPENWLEPELRDDKSPFFKEIESELLQSDITEDSAATALLNYLSKLKEVAKLEPCGIYHIPVDPARRTGEINHVVARSTGAHCTYYYRRHEYGYWTPWEQIKLDIEDNPVIPVVWKDRLFLFWLRILRAPIDPKDQAATPVTTADGKDKRLAECTMTDIKTAAKTDAQKNTQMKVQAVLCWSEYYNGKWQQTKTSDVDKPTLIGWFDSTGQNPFDRSALQLWARRDEAEDALLIFLFYWGGSITWFKMYNMHSMPVRHEDEGPTAIKSAWNIFFAQPPNSFNTKSDTFKVMYSAKIPNGSDLIRHILEVKGGIPYGVVQPLHNLQDQWDAPFFFSDRRHVFYVTTDERIVRIREWNDFGITINPPQWQLDIPPLVLEGIEIIPDIIGPVVASPRMGVADPALIERFVTEDAYIKRGIGATGTVRFGDKQIGLAGGLMNGIKAR